MAVRAPGAEAFEAGLRTRAASGELSIERVEVASVPALVEDFERGAELEMWRLVAGRRAASPSGA